MERKIGEIFKYKGEWYQCMESPNGNCMHCDIDFGGKCPIPIKECTGAYRIDMKHVIFKKLEKVGEPITICGKSYQRYKNFVLNSLTLCKYCIFYSNSGCTCKSAAIKCNNNNFYVEIKQNKEDMEEKKSMTTKFREYLSKVSEEQLEKDLELIKKFNESGVSVDEFIKSQETTQMKPFDLEAAKEGKPVCTRNGSKARIICFDKRGIYPVIALVQEEGSETCHFYTQDGKCADSGNGYDLLMLSEKKKGWVNVHKGLVCTSVYPRIYKSREEAVSDNTTVNRIDTVKISWEE